MDNNSCKAVINKCFLCNGELLSENIVVFDTRFGIDADYNVVGCSTCEIEQTIPVPSSDELKRYYESYYNFGGEKGTLYTRVREFFLFSYIYRLWLIIDGDISFHIKKGSGRLLDIGCNEGRGLSFYHNNGFISEGLELNETAASVSRSRGYRVSTQELNRYHPADAFNVVVLSNVLEHSLNPKDMLRDVSRILEPNGQVWISCPNNKSWLRLVFGRSWINWHVPFHIVHFSPASLKKILQDTGFDQIEIRQETPALWAAHSVIARLFARKGRPTKQLRNPLLVISLLLFWRGLLFPFLWLGNRLRRGDCLVVTARKR